MPANRGVGGPHWHPRADVAPLSVEVHTPVPEPQTRQEIRYWLEDIGASAVALANQFVDPDTAAEALDDMAMRVHEDVKSGYLTLDVAVHRQQARELGRTTFCYLERADGTVTYQAS